MDGLLERRNMTETQGTIIIFQLMCIALILSLITKVLMDRD